MFSQYLQRSGCEIRDLDEAESTRITIRGKGGVWAQLPLPADVGLAIAKYLHRDRPRCSCRRVFIRDRAPLVGFGVAHAISDLVCDALIKAGVESAHKRAHLLRHSLATDMLQKGASLDEIGEVLRHKSPDTTAIYAKVELNALRPLALPWLGVSTSLHSVSSFLQSGSSPNARLASIPSPPMRIRSDC